MAAVLVFKLFMGREMLTFYVNKKDEKVLQSKLC